MVSRQLLLASMSARPPALILILKRKDMFFSKSGAHFAYVAVAMMQIAK